MGRPTTEAQREWRQKRPSWCPHVDCKFVVRSQDSICMGRMPVPRLHDGIENTHRYCQRGAPDDGAWLHTVEWNRGDAWNLKRCIDAVFFPKPATTDTQPTVADPANLDPVHIRLLKRGVRSKWIGLSDDAGTHTGEVCALGELLRAGLVRYTEDELPPGPPSMRPMEITEAGRRALQEESNGMG